MNALWNLIYRSIPLVAASGLAALAGGIAIQWGVATDRSDAAIRLTSVNREIVAKLDRVIDEFRQLGNEINTNPEVPCSAASLEHFRRILFQLEYLRDIGFVRQRSLLCSTALGVIAEPVLSSAADFVLAGGVQVYAYRPVRISAGQSTMVLQRDSYNALVNPSFITGLSSPRSVYTLSIMAGRDGRRFPLHGLRERDADLIHSVDCSARYGFCLEAGASGPQLSPQASRTAGLGILGAGSGLAVFLLGHSMVLRSRNPAFRLKRAIRRRELSAVYQPIFSMPAGRLVGVELLARWPDAPLNLSSAEKFVAEAETHGLIHELTELMVETAANEIGDWMIADPTRTLAINISAYEFAGDRLPEMLDRCFVDLGIQPSQIILELTERSVVSPRRKQLDQLTAAGFQIYVDDLGEGYSSLSYLHHLPLSGVKISRSFTSGLGTDSPKVDLVLAMMELARKRNLVVVLEGIETREQHQAMIGLGPLLCQGFHYAKPMSAECLTRSSPTEAITA